MGGLAGTGKSTVIRSIVDTYPDVLVCTPTGKAAHVLRSKGIEDACTMHSRMYRPIIGDNNALDFQLLSRKREYDVAIVDEASMLSTQLVRDFQKKVGHVLYVGDYGQLEPIGDDPGLMRSLDIRLTQIHRQAQDSPIICFAHHVRQGNAPQTFGDAARVQYGGSADLAEFDVVLCGYNATRVKVNAWIRKQRKYSGRLPEVGEQIICLRNDADWQVWNGMMGTVTAIDTQANRLSVDTDDGPRKNLPFRPDQFGAERTIVEDRQRDRRRKAALPTLWDFGYCITCHRSQGSAWRRVAVKEEIASTWSAARWRYTAATRASQELRWVL
jgi:exodeoxyribonuclease-5